jgi:hypothetical protein
VAGGLDVDDEDLMVSQASTELVRDRADASIAATA